ncbi:MAG: 3-hydroxyacyl-CoA dehydrogenase NAD-binding domain-containing protein [Acidobacteriota bacterium]
MTDELKRVGIIGAGVMGRRIAWGCVIAGKQTRLYDVQPAAVQQALGAVREMVEKYSVGGESPVSIEQMQPEAAFHLLSAASSLEECVEDVDLVIETVPEIVELKREVFAQIARCIHPCALIGTNTSSIPGSWLADATGRPEKFFNFNFGTPEDLKVEVMGHPGTAPETIEAALGFVRSLGLIPLLVRKEINGYACNRVWRAVKKEVLFLLDRGYSTPEDLDRGWMLDWGVAFGPCALMDMVGLDVVRDIEMIYYRASGDSSDKPPPMLEELIARGRLGVKSGEGFFRYPNPAYQRPGFLKGE